MTDDIAEKLPIVAKARRSGAERPPINAIGTPQTVFYAEGMTRIVGGEEYFFRPRTILRM